MAVNPYTANKLAKQQTKTYYYNDPQGPKYGQEVRQLNAAPVSASQSSSAPQQIVGADVKSSVPMGRLTYEQWLDRQYTPSWRNRGIDPNKDDYSKINYQRYLESPEGMTADSKSYAADFRENMPNAQNNLVSSLKNQVNDQVSYGLDQVANEAARKGRGHGGYKMAMDARTKNQGKNALATGVGAINQGLLDHANSLDEQAVKGAINVQESQQRLQDSIYAEALARMQADNAAFGGLMSGVGSFYGTQAGLRAGK